MGAGALVVSRGRAVAPLLHGGGQEQGRRGGTPALPAIAGIGGGVGRGLRCRANCLSIAMKLKHFVLGWARCVIGAAAPRLPNTPCLALPGVRADTQLIALDMAKIAVSAGSACSSGKLAASHVLEAMGAGALAGQAIRVSLPWNVTAEVVPAFLRGV